MRPGRRMRGVAWEEEEGCTVGRACGALGGEMRVELDLELWRRGGGFGFAFEKVYRAINRFIVSNSCLIIFFVSNSCLRINFFFYNILLFWCINIASVFQTKPYNLTLLGQQNIYYFLH